MNLIFDAGATKIRVATTKDSKKIGLVESVGSPKDLNSAIEIIEKVGKKLVGKEKLEKIAGGITGFFDNTKGREASKLLEEKFKVPAIVNNDAAVVGLGEAHFGAGQDHKIVAYLTISTGIGGARIVDGKIDKSAFGFEPGHQIIQFNNENVSNLEEIASGKAIIKKFGKHPKEVRDEKVWDDLSFPLAIGVYNSMLHWSPEIIVLGGPMITGDPAIAIEKVKINLEKLNKIFPRLPEIKMAELEDYGGLYGSLVLP